MKIVVLLVAALVLSACVSQNYEDNLGELVHSAMSLGYSCAKLSMSAIAGWIA